jgi:hypothetical protein
VQASVREDSCICAEGDPALDPHTWAVRILYYSSKLDIFVMNKLLCCMEGFFTA